MAFLVSAGAYAAPYMAAAAATATTAATAAVAYATPIVTSTAAYATTMVAATVTKTIQIGAVYFATAPLRWSCADSTLFNEEHCASAFKSVGCFFMKATELTSCGGHWVANGQMFCDAMDFGQMLKKIVIGG
jgi:hypothetical protein